MRGARHLFILMLVSMLAAAPNALAASPASSAATAHGDERSVAARQAGQNSSFASLCAGGAIAGVVTTARLGIGVANLEYATLGAVAAASAATGCVLAVVMQGVVVDCISGSLAMEPVGLFTCTVAAVEKLQGGASQAAAASHGITPTPTASHAGSAAARGDDD